MATYFFSGIKHCGKSTHAKLFAKRRNLPFYDLDDLILENTKEKTVREFYRNYGKEAFIEEEYKALNTFLNNNQYSKVIALGGGIADNKNAFTLCRENGILVFIQVDESTLFKRIMAKGTPPFLEGNPKKKFHELFTNREKIYKESANIIVEIKDQPIEITAEEIEQAIKEQEL